MPESLPIARRRPRNAAYATAVLLGAAIAATLAQAPPAEARTADPTPQYVSNFGNCGAGAGQFESAWGLAVTTDGSVYVGDSGTNRVVQFDASGAFVRAWATPVLAGIAAAPDGSLWITCPEISKAQHYSSAGTLLGSLGTFGNHRGQFINPLSVAVDPSGFVYVADEDNGRVQKFTSDGVYQTGWGTPGTAIGEMIHPTAMATDSQGEIFVVDAGNQRVNRFTFSGAFLGSWGVGGSDGHTLQLDDGLASDPQGNVYVTDAFSRVLKFSADGTWLSTFGEVGSGDGQFSVAWSVAVAPGGIVYVADQGFCRVDKFLDSTGSPAVTTSWGAVKAIYR